MTEFPTSPETLTAEFLAEVLDLQVSDVRCEEIGAGLVGDSMRIHLTYADNGSGPVTIAGKFPAADETSRATAASLGLYAKEVGFYRNVAHKIATRTPRVHFAEVTENPGDFLLLMEDCGPAEQGDQLAGCSLEQAQVGLRELAGLHGPTFGRGELLTLPFLQVNEAAKAFVAASYAEASAKFCEFYDGKLEPELLSLVGKVGERSASLFTEPTPTGPCVIHGDFRLDNVLFSILGGAEPMVTLDWQTVALGDPLIDLGYFMGAGISPDLRQANEDALLELYGAEYAEQGGPELDRAAMASGYARGALHGITTAVFSAAFVEHNERSEAIFHSMARGAAILAHDCNALDLLE